MFSHSAYDCVVPSKGKALVKTDIQIELPSGCYGRVAPRSGLAHKNFIDVGAGVIDEDYRGNVGVILFNFSEEEFKVIENEVELHAHVIQSCGLLSEKTKQIT